MSFFGRGKKKTTRDAPTVQAPSITEQQVESSAAPVAHTSQPRAVDDSAYGAPTGDIHGIWTGGGAGSMDASRLEEEASINGARGNVGAYWQAAERAARFARFDDECGALHAEFDAGACDSLDPRDLLMQDERILADIPCLTFVGFPTEKKYRGRRAPNQEGGDCRLVLTERPGTAGRASHSLLFLQNRQQRSFEASEFHTSSVSCYARACPCLPGGRGGSTSTRYSASRDGFSSMRSVSVEDQLLGLQMEVLTKTRLRAAMANAAEREQRCCGGCDCAALLRCDCAALLGQCVRACSGACRRLCAGGGGYSEFAVSASAAPRPVAKEVARHDTVQAAASSVGLDTEHATSRYYALNIAFADPSALGARAVTVVVRPHVGKQKLAELARLAQHLDSCRQYQDARVRLKDEVRKHNGLWNRAIKGDAARSRLSFAQVSEMHADEESGLSCGYVLRRLMRWSPLPL